ncbi:MAG TPA: ferredoxin [Frankiaceae bacterium]|nr:ferredoxin [Frankiaceae bacterium]
MSRNATVDPTGAVADASAALQVRVDQDLCTGDGLCVQLAPEVFAFDVDGLAYIKGRDGELRTEPGAAVPVPHACAWEVVEAAADCPGECIFVTRRDGTAVAGPGA